VVVSFVEIFVGAFGLRNFGVTFARGPPHQVLKVDARDEPVSSEE